MTGHEFTWYEFFSGGGMARLGLGNNWNCIFANDWCSKKANAYRARFGTSPELVVADVEKIELSHLPKQADLIWASFPCQDLSLAGNYAGLKGERSGTFLPFWKLMKRLIADGRKPPIMLLENVVGALTSHSGRDFETILCCLAGQGYRVGAMVIDALRFVPQSRPRLFILGYSNEINVPPALASNLPTPWLHPRNLMSAYERLPSDLKAKWLFWNLPEPPRRVRTLADLIEDVPTAVQWHTARETERLLSLMSDLNLHKVFQAQKLKHRIVGTIYRRTRMAKDQDGQMRKLQRAEVRFDGVSGCLRTPVGGSSRQTIMVIEGTKIRSRLLSPREAARLMGVPEDYPLPENYNEAYHVFGDGLVVPLVGWLEKHLLHQLAVLKSGDVERVA